MPNRSWIFIKIYSKILPQILPRRSQILQNRLLGLSWSSLGTLLAPSWRRSDNKNSKTQKISDFRVAQGVQTGPKIDTTLYEKYVMPHSFDEVRRSPSQDFINISNSSPYSNAKHRANHWAIQDGHIGAEGPDSTEPSP